MLIRALHWPSVVHSAWTTRVGVTPHDVVFESGSLRLLRYRRTSPATQAKPLLICYALINRPYILDLQQQKSVVQRYLDTVFADDAAKPWIPPPAARAYISHRRDQARFEQAVLDRIGRSDERFLPGVEAARIRQPTLLLWCRQDAVIDVSAMALYARQIPQARQVLLDGCGHMSLIERPDAVANAVRQLLQ